MSAEFDYDLTQDQWEALRALRVNAPASRRLDRYVIDQLIVLDLATWYEGEPLITPRGRKVLIRGSSRLLDVAA
jgi:hypothetical protein